MKATKRIALVAHDKHKAEKKDESGNRNSHPGDLF